MMQQKGPFKTQIIDEGLMASLEQLDAPDSQQWFPASKGKLRRPKAVQQPKPAAHKQTTMPVHPKLPAAPKTHKIPTRAKRRLALLSPVAVTLILVSVSTIFRLANLPVIPSDAQGTLLLFCALLEVVSFVALTLYYLGELRHVYVFSAENEAVTTKNTRRLAFGLIAWPIFITILLGVVLFAFPGDAQLLGTLSGLSAILLLTGPLTLALGGILLWVLSLYQKTTVIPYPPYVHEAIDLVWHQLH